MQKRVIKDQRCEQLDGALEVVMRRLERSGVGGGDDDQSSLSFFSLPLAPYRSLTASCSAVTRTAWGAAGASVVIALWRAREREKVLRASRLFRI